MSPRKCLQNYNLTFFFLLAMVSLIGVSLYLNRVPLPLPWSPSSSVASQWQKSSAYCVTVKCLIQRLQKSITFLPLKDLRYSNLDHSWFMSSINDTHDEDGLRYQEFPSEASFGRLLCLKGKDTHDGSRNSYALAWPEALPASSTLLTGLTFVSYNHYDFDNIWHGLSAAFPFVSWHQKNQYASPERWVLYHWGELRANMNPWLRTLLMATFNVPIKIEGFEWGGDDESVCFERAVVMRQNEGGMSEESRMKAYELIRCKARKFCNVTTEENTSSATATGDRSRELVGVTLLLRTGARSFSNESEVIRVFNDECSKIEACSLRIAYSNNLTVCDQVKLMSMTNILVSPHGAQLTNLFLMDRNSSVMEFYPMGWLRHAGVGQYVYQWLASWSGMKHQGAWRDPRSFSCPFPDGDGRCIAIVKEKTIGINQTECAEWARKVLRQVRAIKKNEKTRTKPAHLLCE